MGVKGVIKKIFKKRLFKGYMDKLKVGIVGVGSIGKYHAREFFLAGCEIAAIFTTKKEKESEKKRLLKEEFEIKTNAFCQMDKFLEEKLDIVSICSPPETHYNLIKKCLGKGIHVLCEKPFVENEKKAKELFKIARENKLILCVNTQWPSILEKLNKKINFEKIDYFEGTMEPGLEGIKMIEDHVPHLNSIILKMFGKGKAGKIKFPKKEEEHIVVKFNYYTERGIKRIEYKLDYKKDRPRKISFIFGDKQLERRIGENYQQRFFLIDKNTGKEEEILLEDPLKVSIRMFIEAVKGKSEPLVLPEEIIENIKIQNKIIKGYKKLDRVKPIHN